MCARSLRARPVCGAGPTLGAGTAGTRPEHARTAASSHARQAEPFLCHRHNTAGPGVRPAADFCGRHQYINPQYNTGITQPAQGSGRPLTSQYNTEITQPAQVSGRPLTFVALTLASEGQIYCVSVQGDAASPADWPLMSRSFAVKTSVLPTTRRSRCTRFLGTIIWQPLRSSQ